MREQTEIQLNGCENDLSKNIFLFQYNMASMLCVKAEPLSLLDVEIQIGGSSKKIEKVADVSIPRKDQFQVFLRNQNDLEPTRKAICSEHPEFLWEIVKDTAYEDQIERENTLLFTMPPVNKERRDLLLQMVDALYLQAKTQFERQKAVWTGNITRALAGNPTDLKEAQDKLDELYDEKTAQLINAKNAKIQEIEEAYEEYQENHGDDDGSKKKASADGNGDDEDVKNSLKFDDSWKNI